MAGDNETLQINLASFFKIFFESDSCERELQQIAAKSNVVIPGPTTTGQKGVILVNVIESQREIDLSSFGCDQTVSKKDCSPLEVGTIRVNIVIPSWCDSGCAPEGNIYQTLHNYILNNIHFEFNL